MLDPNFFLQIYSSWVEISVLAKFQPPRLPRSGRFMVGDKSNNKKFHRINGFLSLQNKLRMEPGLRLS